jgi:predicted small lipoprotein YifL
MKSLTLAILLLITQSAYAGCGGFGPGGCEFPVAPVETPEQFCFNGICNNVTGEWFGDFYVVRSVLPTGYGVMGWGGPCPQHDCPDIGNQALRDLAANADQINRAWYR